MSPAGVLLNEFPTAAFSGPAGIVSGPDGALWFSEADIDKIGRMTTTGVFTDEVALTPGAGPDGVTRGPAGNIWFAESFGDRVGRISLLAADSVSLTSSANPAVAGQSVTFTATTGCGFGRAATGTITFVDGRMAIGTTPLAGGVATFSIATLGVGSHAITAAYAGDANCGAVTSTVLTQNVNPVGAGATVTSTTNPSTNGQTVTFTAIITCAGFTPTGTVTFKDGGAPLATAPLSGGGTATFSTAALSPGSHAVTASYGGDLNCVAVTSPAITQVVGSATSTVTLTSSTAFATTGQAVTFTATVICTSSTPTGSVSFLDDDTVLGSAALVGGRASFTTTALALGRHQITATYAGDAGCAAGVSVTLVQHVITPPVATHPAGPAFASAGSAADVVFGSFSDNVCTAASRVSSAPATTYKVSITWGDGNSSPGVVTDACGVVAFVSGTHTYATAGDFTAVASVTGSDGVSFSISIGVHVAPAAALSPLTVGGPTLTVGVITVSGCGSVTDQSANGPSLLGAMLQVGQSVFPYATPCAGYAFAGWVGGGPGCDGKQVNPCLLVVPPTGVSLTAVFTPIK